MNIFETIDSPVNMIPLVRCRASFCVNGSHFCSLGVMPGYKCPTYYELRNRYSDVFKSNLMSEEMKSVCDRKFIDSMSELGLAKEGLIKIAFYVKPLRKLLKFINWTD